MLIKSFPKDNKTANKKYNAIEGRYAVFKYMLYGQGISDGHMLSTCICFIWSL